MEHQPRSKCDGLSGHARPEGAIARSVSASPADKANFHRNPCKEIPPHDGLGPGSQCSVDLLESPKLRDLAPAVRVSHATHQAPEMFCFPSAHGGFWAPDWQHNLGPPRTPAPAYHAAPAPQPATEQHCAGCGHSQANKAPRSHCWLHRTIRL